MFRKIDPTLALVLLLSLFSIGPLLQPGYFWEAHDARHSVYFVFELDRSIQDGVLYPRWQPDFSFGYGYPFFNIYGPLASYAAEAFHLLGFSFTGAVKIVFALSITLSGLAMYAFVRRALAGNNPEQGARARLAALVAAVAYMVIPYRLVDVYVRAALAESVAYVFIPLVLWGAWATVRQPRLSNVIGLAVTYAALVLTSPLVALLFSLILAVYLAMLALARISGSDAWRRRSRESWPALAGYLAHVAAPAVFGLGLGLGLSAGFILPAMTESRYVRVDQWYGGRYAWGGDFVEFYQLFSPSWGFGASVPGPDDGLSFQLGVVPVVLGLFALGMLASRWRRSRSEAGHVRPGDLPDLLLGIFFAGLGIVAVWLMLGASEPVWRVLPLARLVQFPWRLLSVTTVAGAFLCGLTAYGLRPAARFIEPVALVLAGLLILGSLPYMQARMSEQPVSLAGLMRFQQSADEMTGSTAWVSEIPTWSPLADYYIAGQPVTSKIDYETLYRQAGRVRAETLELHTDRELIAYSASRPALITFNTFYYPGWRAYLLDAETGRPAQELSIATRGKLGLMTVRVPAGEGRVLLRLEDTPIRELGTAISFASVLLIAGLAVAAGLDRRRRSVASNRLSGRSGTDKNSSDEGGGQAGGDDVSGSGEDAGHAGTEAR